MSARLVSVPPSRPLVTRAPLRAVALAAGAAAFVLAVVLGLLAGFGLLYVLRGLGWMASGPRVGDALPLLQLAGFDGQPLLRLAVAWLLAGGMVGLALVRTPPVRRALCAGLLGLVALLVASQAADALTRNLRFSVVLTGRTPGLGPWLEAAGFTLGCLLPRRLVGQRRVSRDPGGGLWGAGHLGLGPGQHRDAAENDGNGDEMSDHGERVGAQRLGEGDRPTGQGDERTERRHE